MFIVFSFFLLADLSHCLTLYCLNNNNNNINKNKKEEKEKKYKIK